MAKKTKKTTKKADSAPVVTIHGEAHATPVTVSVGGMRMTFTYNKPTPVTPEVMEALKNSAGITYTVEN